MSRDNETIYRVNLDDEAVSPQYQQAIHNGKVTVPLFEIYMKHIALIETKLLKIYGIIIKKKNLYIHYLTKKRIFAECYHVAQEFL